MTSTLKKYLNRKTDIVLDVNCDIELSDILRINLEQADIGVISARSGADALKLAASESPDLIILDAALPDTDGIEVCRRLKDTPATSRIPVFIIVSEAPPGGHTRRSLNGADLYISKPFDPKDVVRLAQSYLVKKKRMQNINPLTGLPNQFQVTNEVNSLIRQSETFAFIRFDIVNLKIFNRAYGFSQGDLAIQLLAEAASEALRRFGNQEDLAGHLGGDDFIIITSVRKARTLCRRVIADFNRRKKTLYNHEDLLRGYIECEGRFGVKEQFPIMSVRAAVVTNEKKTFGHYLEIMEAASEQMEYLSRFPGVTCYYDIREAGLETGTGSPPSAMPREHREENKTLQGVLAWLTFLTGEIKEPVMSVDNLFKDLVLGTTGPDAPSSNLVNAIKEKIARLACVVEILENLVTECPLSKIAPDELSLKKLLSWVEKQVRYLAEKRNISFETTGADESESLLMDGRTLAQALLYLVRSEIEAGSPGDIIRVSVSLQNDDFVNLQINSRRYLPPRVLHRLLQDNSGVTPYEPLRYKLYPARLLIQGLGGKLNITSEKEVGTTYSLILPARWQSWMPEVNALLFATDISRKQARAEIKNLHRHLSSLLREVPPELESSLVELRQRVQELGILCNRSLYLAEDFNSRLETQQDQWLQQETEQVATLEAILTIISRMSSLLMIHTDIFNLENARILARNTMAIAGELKLPDNDRRALYYASLLKDMGLFRSAGDMVEQGVVSTSEEAVYLGEHFTPVWKALSAVPFFNSALSLILYNSERYDGKGGRFGVSGSRIPLGARILAVADTFDALTSGELPGEKLSAENAVQRIAGESGTAFDPEVVNAFLMAWKRHEVILPTAERAS
jgi:diguanylate cyclase (GGDEF)-like protein